MAENHEKENCRGLQGKVSSFLNKTSSHCQNIANLRDLAVQLCVFQRLSLRANNEFESQQSPHRLQDL